MLRTFDHAGYYETRLILMIICLAIAGYFSYYKRDQRFLLIFASSAFFMLLTEYFLQLRGLRGEGYSCSIAGFRLSPEVGALARGILEGGACGLFAFWFADLRSSRVRQKKWLAFYGLCVIVILSATIAGLVARNRPISSARPMFAISWVIFVTAIIFVSLLIAWRKNALSDLANFCGGLLLFAILTNEPLQLAGAMYIGTYSGSQFTPVSIPIQIGMMLLSNIFEFSGSKLLFFAAPYGFGWIIMKRREPHEPYSTQHLLDLAQRGWQSQSNPFKRDQS